MAMSAGTRLAPSTFIADEQSHRRSIAQWMREAHQGHLGNVGTLTLAANVATTIVVDFRVGPNTTICLSPLTANAAGALATTYISSRLNESFTITHANTATTDRTFAYCVLG